MNKPTNFQELFDAVKNKKIVSATSSNGTKFRFFISTNESLCYFAAKSSRKGPYFPETMFPALVNFQFSKPRTEESFEKKIYNQIAKYKRMAEKATFTNNFITDCKALPASFDQWKKELKEPNSWDIEQKPRPKSLFDYSITTGNKIDGVVISIERIGKQYPRYAERLREAIKNQSEGHICSSTPFAGYEMTLSTAKREGMFFGYLSLEYKGCGNGYYYLLINDDNFIGYDVD